MIKQEFYNLFSLCIKNERNNLLSKNREVILNRANECYRNNRDELKVKARD